VRDQQPATFYIEDAKKQNLWVGLGAEMDQAEVIS